MGDPIWSFRRTLLLDAVVLTNHGALSATALLSLSVAVRGAMFGESLGALARVVLGLGGAAGTVFFLREIALVLWNWNLAVRVDEAELEYVVRRRRTVVRLDDLASVAKLSDLTLAFDT